MSGGIDRSQGRDLGSSKVAWQDRSTFVTDGGNWSWNSGTGQLSWSATINVRRSSLSSMTIAAGNVTLAAAGAGAYIVLNRSAGGATSATALAIDDAANRHDDRIFLAVRGSDNRVYLWTGDVLSNGDSRPLGELVQKVDRSTVIADGLALQSVGFTYVPGQSQLAVFVQGGLRELTANYAETDATHVTFAGGSIPTIGQVIHFVNLAGAQGPPGSGSSSLQDAYDTGPSVVTTAATPISVKTDEGTDATVLQRMGNTAQPDNLQFRRDGAVGFKDGGAGTWWWVNVSEKLVLYNSNSNVAVRFDNVEGTMEFGSFTIGGGFTAAGGALRWTEYAGVFSGMAPTNISTGMASSDIHAVLLKAVDGVTGRSTFSELSLGSSAAKSLYVSEASGTIRISGDRNGSAPVGVDFQAEAYTLVVLHR